MRRIRWGVISTADIAKTKVIPAILHSDYAEVAAIASRGDKAKEIAERFSIPKFYDSYHKLLMDQEIEAVYIPLPNHLHKQWVMEAAKHGKHVLVEKPAALTAKETQEMVECCRENNVIFMEAFMHQFHPQHHRVREIVTSGEIGEIKFMRACFSYFLKDELTNIRMKKEMGGGSIYDIGCYCIHAIRNILKSEPVRVEAFAELDGRNGIDRSAIVYMKLENGINTVFDCSFDMSFRQEYEIVGTKGRITVPAAYRPDVADNEGVILIESENGTRSEMITADQYKMQIDHFSQVIIEGSAPSYSAKNTLQNMRVIDACYQSIESRAAVALV
ncbi:Gfo/Idh/MocA family oxidoreductase [Paenibacillus sp. BSR1-1]|uniref:Gfo/Idh/MocA family protein n=1 Tax=Paenibacillus sp. BSR1-1 TaxID=3020845 RepID=UPI0025B1118B|nr:Gfo/Idh/MocA family oxidoreductase [Paenibacillus sp. BSR1-1]MDN3017122.1 Gfo/Idh/MocA family oxidoreductase [Paenibacillus sp. BSR1-1]